ncbi:MAG: hypothetical protein ACRDN0_19600 [Trebonia sp.]
MTVWYTTRGMGWRTKAVIAAGLLAVLLVAVVPVALFVGAILMLLGHVVGGLALFGASVLAAVAAVSIASLSGVRHLRNLLRRKLVSEPPGETVNEPDCRVVRLPRDEYHYD